MAQFGRRQPFRNQTRPAYLYGPVTKQLTTSISASMAVSAPMPVPLTAAVASNLVVSATALDSLGSTTIACNLAVHSPIIGPPVPINTAIALNLTVSATSSISLLHVGPVFARTVARSQGPGAPSVIRPSPIPGTPPGGPGGNHDYAVVVVDKYGVAYGQIVSAVPTQIDWTLNGLGQALIDFSILDPSLGSGTTGSTHGGAGGNLLPISAIPGGREIQIWRDGQLIWWGVPTGVSFDAKQVHLTCQGLLWYVQQTSFGPITTNYAMNASFEEATPLGPASSAPSWIMVGYGFGAYCAIGNASMGFQVLTGSQSVQLVSLGAFDNIYLQQDFNISAGPEGLAIFVSGWFYIQGAFTPGPSNLGIQMFGTGVTVISQGSITPDVPSNVWQRLTAECFVPPNTSVTVAVALQTVGGIIYWDDINVTVEESVGTPPTGADAQFAMSEIIRYFNDATRGKSDHAMPFNGPLTGKTLVRIYQLFDNAPVLDALNEYPTIGVCFPGDTEVLASELEGATRRWYEGELVEITTASGKHLAGTPNHPVRTAHGWVPLGTLSEGDEVVSQIVADPSAGPHDDQQPTAIQDVFATLSEAGRTLTLPVAAVHFHGEMSEGEVQVVRTDRELRHDPDMASDEEISQVLLRLRTEAATIFSGQRAGDETRQIDSRGVGRGTVGSTRASRPNAGVREEQSFPWGPNVRPALGQTATNRFGAYSVTIGEFFEPDTFGVGLAEHASVQAGSRPLARGIKIGTPPEKPSLAQDAGESMAAQPTAQLHLLEGSTVEVGLDRVLDLSRRWFAGHVYNLHTRLSRYFANDILVHNCDFEVIWDASGHYRYFQIFPPAKGSHKYNYPLELGGGHTTDLQGTIDGTQVATAVRWLGQGSVGSSEDMGYAAFPSLLGGKTATGATTFNSNVVTTTSALFTPSDVGQPIYCLNTQAFPVGTVITAYTSATQVTVSKPAELTLGSVVIGVGGLILDSMQSALPDQLPSTLQASADNFLARTLQAQFLPTAKARADGPQGKFGVVEVGDVIPVVANYGWLSYGPTLARVTTISLYPPTEEMAITVAPLPILEATYA